MAIKNKSLDVNKLTKNDLINLVGAYAIREGELIRVVNELTRKNEAAKKALS